MSHYGTAAGGGVPFYELDNEPSLWDSTHRDIHPAALTYDELVNRSTAAAAAVKTADGTAAVLGPSDWGWCAYFFSAADGCNDGSDRASHGDVDFAAYYLGTDEGVRHRPRATRPRLLRRALLPAGLGQPDDRGQRCAAGPAADGDAHPVGPLVQGRQLDRPGRRTGRRPDPADARLGQRQLPRHQAVDQRVQLRRPRVAERCTHPGRRAGHLRPRAGRPRYAVGRPLRHRAGRLCVPAVPQLRRQLARPSATPTSARPARTRPSSRCTGRSARPTVP